MDTCFVCIRDLHKGKCSGCQKNPDLCICAGGFEMSEFAEMYEDPQILDEDRELDKVKT